MSQIYTDYNQEYVQFIKKCLIHSCKTLYMDSVEKNWESVFQVHHSMVMYYLHLSTNFQMVISNHRPIANYSHNELATEYKYMSFQEFIDNEMKDATENDIRLFTNSMKDWSFVFKMNKKYKTDIALRTLKNHIAYVTNLSVNKLAIPQQYFSIDEQIVMYYMIDALPYFEFVNENAHYLYNDTNEDACPDVTAFKLHERSTIQQINEHIRGTTYGV